ncbi:MAG TPA: hypothetical protein VIM21_15360 [Gemmatimonadaceae bacterium]
MRATPALYAASLLRDVVPGDHPPERKAAVVVEAVVNSSVESRYGLLLGDSREFRTVLDVVGRAVTDNRSLAPARSFITYEIPYNLVSSYL